jgi:hypothetical protein
MVDHTDFQLDYYFKTINIPYLGALNIDDLIYLLCMLLAIPVGLLFRNNMRPKAKALLSAMLGFTVTALVCGKDIYHSLTVMFVNTVVCVAVNPRYVHYFSFVWCMGYLLFFRMSTIFGIDKPIQFANAIQLILTLKVMKLGLCFSAASNLAEIGGSHKSNRSNY